MPTREQLVKTLHDGLAMCPLEAHRSPNCPGLADLDTVLSDQGVPESWPSEELLDSNSTDNYLLGIAVGWEQVAGWLRKESGAHFSNNDDERARLLRSYANEAKKMALTRRAEHQQHVNEYTKAAAEATSKAGQ